ncbi:MAG: ribosome biogenesis GTPase YlqF, partial [Halarsenatibacteraceae bacterium]
PETGQGLKNLKNRLREYYKEVNAEREEKGLNSRKIRAMVVGLPNVGKSTLINKLAGGSRAKTGRRPGVTRVQQWIKVSSEAELLDTPGLLWPDIKDKEHGYKLAICGMIRPEIIDYELLGCKLIEYLLDLNPEVLKDRYNLIELAGHSYDLLADLGRNRGCLMTGGRVDRERAARILLQEFQDGTLGPVSLEKPPADNNAENSDAIPEEA